MPLEDSKAITSPPFLPQIGQRFQSLIWTCLDFDLVRSAVFYAERYHVMDENNHDTRHLYATALLRSGQSHSGLQLVNGVQQSKCSGCLEIKGKCCAALGRHRLAREALEASLQDSTYTPPSEHPVSHYLTLADFRPASLSPLTRAFAEEAAIRCRSGTMAMKGNLPEHATHSFRQALALNPMLWEAFEGLCSLGDYPLLIVLSCNSFDFVIRYSS
jgi:anaphase-promoting complex subunit 3